MIFYHCLTTLLFVAALPLLPLVWLFSAKRRANLRQRLGLATGLSGPAGERRCLWVHALSVGEVQSAEPLVRELRQRHPKARIVFTASTKTGFETARRLMADVKENPALVDSFGYFPLDLWFAVSRVASKIRPDLVCLVETDLWPGFLRAMKQNNIPVVLINARLSKRAYDGYRRFRIISGAMFSSLSHVMAQTELDAQRFVEAGAAKNRVSVTGNIKFDRTVPVLDDAMTASVRRDLGLGPAQPAWVAGSTHEGEEKILLTAFQELRTQIPDLKLIIAPRDPSRGAKLAGTFRDLGERAACLSDPDVEKETVDIVFIDRLGMLMSAYAVSGFAFVGGSLVAEGGHNPLEPAMFAKPVLFGPHMSDFHEVAHMLIRAGGACEVRSAQEASLCIRRLMADAQQRAAMGHAANQVFTGNQGAVARTVDIMEALTLA